MTKIFALLFAVIGLLLISIGLVLRREHPAMLALAVLGAVITYLAFSLDQRREKTAIEQHNEEVQRRVEALENAPWDEGYFLEVNKNGLTMLFLIALSFVASAWFAYSSLMGTASRWGAFAGSSLFSLLMLFILLRLLAGLGKPELVMSLAGIQTPWVGVVPWRAVAGINLQKITVQGRTTNTLAFKLEPLAEDAPVLHWSEAVLAAFGLGVRKKKIVQVVLNGASEAPETVYAVARHLWHRNTGMNHQWSPMWSKEANQAARRTHEFIERYKDADASAEEILRDPDAAERDVEQFRRDIDTLNAEQRRVTAWSNWILAIGALGMGAAFLWPVVKRYFS